MEPTNPTQPTPPAQPAQPQPVTNQAQTPPTPEPTPQPSQPSSTSNPPTSSTTPNPSATPKSRMPLLILSVIVLAVVALGTGIFLMYQTKTNPSTTQVATIQEFPTPTQSPIEATVESITIEDVNSEMASLEGSLNSL